MLFVLNLTGLGLRPQQIGIASDVMRQWFDNASLRYPLPGAAFVNFRAAYDYYAADKTITCDTRNRVDPGEQLRFRGSFRSCIVTALAGTS